MDESFQVFQPAYQFIDARLAVFLDERVGAVIDQVAAPLRAALVLYVLLYGFAILRGAIAEPIIDFAVRSLKLALIYMLATTVAYSSYVGDALFQVFPNTLAQAVSGASTPDVGAAFDGFLARAAYLADKIAQQGGPIDYSAWALSVVVVLVGRLSAALGFGVVMLAKVALAMIVALGPIFIACALFEASRRFFFGWLAQAVNYLVLFALIITVFQLVLSLVDQQWSRVDGMDPQVGGLLFITLCLLGCIFFLQIPTIAAGIAGGASAGLTDFANAAGLRSHGGGRTDRSQSRARPAGGSITPVGGPR